MKRSILAYGHHILKQKCNYIEKDYPELDKLIADMWETMENANGCGLASPQIGLPIRLFIVDSKSTFDNLGEEDRKFYFPQDDKGIMETFINAKIIQRSEELWDDEEGCLSIPNLFYKVKRNWAITIEYYNRNFEKQIRTFSGTTARMIQHEYDHTEGVLYLDYLKPLTKRLMASKLQKILKGQIVPAYPMNFIR
ncbi:peptide deformylase [Pseudopedobacter saltans DSM 12145]|uniref:Peptide deformylase n=1 Tax=Pseudopedobacter saltans (strain ATCC 51119 / DSM 12145 / JCM 21818 / CCUG 39354 / LMG 10337 / NBRC 100064 / NCIMB 13643) TaxID=762903 RepID=F0S6U7_PSESL|nr:peptide deformylase [Pseudopedobacter saltans]ADY52207.1 peptide deformylase [Pseudopedobacter saltans DSM 12145]